MRFPFTASEESVSIFLNGRMHNLASTLKGFTDLVEHLKGTEHDAEFIENIIDRPSMVARLTAGAVTVVGSTVFHNGIPAHSTLTLKLVAMLDAGFDAGPWINFFNKVQSNPSERSRQCLYDFLEKWKAPLTPDGDFIAFKYVNADYMDGRTGTFDNHPGNTVSMPRDEVDPDPTQTCSRGLHVCASVYLSGYNMSKHIVAVQVNPANVVAVPNDYDHAKMRVCEYLVLSDVENPKDGGIAAIEAQQVYVPEPTVEVPDLSSLELLGGSFETTSDPVWFQGGIYDAKLGINSMRYVSGGLDDMQPDETINDCMKRLYAGGAGVVVTADGSLGLPDDDDYDGSAAVERDIAAREAESYSAENLDEDDDAYDGWDTHPDLVDTSDDTPSPEILGGPFFTTTAGEVYAAKVLLEGVAKLGQRGYATVTGIPRSTLQGWLSSLAK